VKISQNFRHFREPLVKSIWPFSQTECCKLIPVYISNEHAYVKNGFCSDLNNKTTIIKKHYCIFFPGANIAKILSVRRWQFSQVLNICHHFLNTHSSFHPLIYMCNLVLAYTNKFVYMQNYEIFDFYQAKVNFENNSFIDLNY